MASRGWSKIKSGKGKGKLVNSDGKTAFQVRQEKYYAAKASGGGVVAAEKLKSQNE